MNESPYRRLANHLSDGGRLLSQGQRGGRAGSRRHDATRSVNRRTNEQTSIKMTFKAGRRMLESTCRAKYAGRPGTSDRSTMEQRKRAPVPKPCTTRVEVCPALPCLTACRCGAASARSNERAGGGDNEGTRGKEENYSTKDERTSASK